ncbi:MAG: (2Fe-2S) ferredoxin domain-containing protein [Candidatus Eisenbacteria bacterium]
MESQAQPYELLILVCVNQRPDGKACCMDGPAQEIRDTMKEKVKARGLKGRVRVSQTGCLDRCSEGPNVFVFPAGTWYSHVTLEDIDTILARHVDPLCR